MQNMLFIAMYVYMWHMQGTSSMHAHGGLKFFYTLVFKAGFLRYLELVDSAKLVGQ